MEESQRVSELQTQTVGVTLDCPNLQKGIIP